MSEYGERIGRDAVRFQRLLPGPIERVWEHLVDPDLRAKWFCGGKTELEAGGRIELEFDHANLSPLPDDPPPPRHADLPEHPSYRGIVTHCEPPRLFAFTWVGEDEHSQVRFELEPKGQQVLLTLTHSDLRSRADVIEVSGGWHTHLDFLADVLAGAVPAPFWRRYNALDLRYQQQFGEG